MTLENTLLERLSEWQPPVGRQDLHIAADGWSVRLTADRSDALGTLAWELDLRRDGSDECDVEKWATAAVERVGGLMEALKIVEIDTIRKKAQLRSEAPTQRGEKRLYYEVILSALGRATLHRYQTVNGTAGREQILFAVTHEALAKLAGDVAGSA